MQTTLEEIDPFVPQEYDEDRLNSLKEEWEKVIIPIWQKYFLRAENDSLASNLGVVMLSTEQPFFINLETEVTLRKLQTEDEKAYIELAMREYAEVMREIGESVGFSVSDFYNNLMGLMKILSQHFFVEKSVLDHLPKTWKDFEKFAREQFIFSAKGADDPKLRLPDHWNNKEEFIHCLNRELGLTTD